MKRIPLLLALVALVFAPALASGDEAKKKPAADKIPPISSDEEVAQALDEYKQAFKAKGLKGDDRSAQRDYAMEQLSAYQHKKVVDVLAKNMKHSDEYVRLAAVVHLGAQRALPAYAGKKIADMMKKYRKDVFFLISAFDSIGKLKYLGAMDAIVAGLKHQDFGIKKAAIASIGQIGEYRLMYDMLKQVGIDAERAASGEAPPKAGSGGGEPEKDGESVTWEGAEAEVDTGTAGDGDQKAAEKAAKEKAAANEAAAKQKAGAGGGIGSAGTSGGMGGSSGGSASGGTGRGASGRSKQELIYPIKDTLAKLTGEDFTDARTIYKWLADNADLVKTKCKEVAKAEKVQKDADKQK